jgi:hypothetical protein
MQKGMQDKHAGKQKEHNAHIGNGMDNLIGDKQEPGKSKHACADAGGPKWERMGARHIQGCMCVCVLGRGVCARIDGTEAKGKAVNEVCGWSQWS